jgi:hypothetical protein
MAIVASIYMAAPNILVSDFPSGWGLVSVNPVGFFGKIEQVNPQTVGMQVGNVIFYNPINEAAVMDSSQNTYKIINENAVQFIESANIAAP